jgi:hypothetical protein
LEKVLVGDRFIFWYNKPPTEDENDLIDSVTPKDSVRAKSAANLRATCQIILEPGATYKISFPELNVKSGRE